MATILDNQRAELENRILGLEGQRALIDEQLEKLRAELEFLAGFLPATEGD